MFFEKQTPKYKCENIKCSFFGSSNAVITIDRIHYQCELCNTCFKVNKKQVFENALESYLHKSTPVGNTTGQVEAIIFVGKCLIMICFTLLYIFKSDD